MANAGLLGLAGAWHARVMADEVVSHAFSHGYHPEHTERLAAYWAEALGGPTTYSTRYGDETSVVRMHSGNGPHEDMDHRAIACFDQALIDAGLAGDDAFAAGAARLLRVGDAEPDGPLSPLCGRCARWVAHPPVVLGGLVTEPVAETIDGPDREGGARGQHDVVSGR